MKNQFSTNKDLRTVSVNNKLISQQDRFKKSVLVHGMLRGLETSVAIINTANELVFVSDVLLENFGYASAEELLGRKMGEALKCVYNISKIENTKRCSSCGLKSVFRHLNSPQQKNKMDVFLVVYEGDVVVEKKYKIASTPLSFEGGNFLILTVNEQDIGKGIEHLGAESFKHEKCDLTYVEQVISRGLRREVDDAYTLFQHLFSEAQNTRVTMCKEKLNSKDVFKSMKLHFNTRCDVTSIEINKGLEFDVFNFYSDKNILMSALMILLTSVLSVPSEYGSIEISILRLVDSVVFSFHTDAVMPLCVQLQVYRNRKGTGICTMKLFVEKFMKGTVYFTSVEGLGTTFYLKLPFLSIC